METSVETEKCVRTHAGWNGTNGTEEDEDLRKSGARRQTPWDRGTHACEIHVGGLYYREFPFGGYCEEAPVAHGVAFFPGARVCTRARAHACSLSDPVSIRTRNASRAAINQNLGDSRPRRLRIYAVYDAPEGNCLDRA